MLLNAARLPARLDESGNLTRLFDQDRSRWDPKLADDGLTLLASSAIGNELSEYHLEAAAIAAIHASATRAEDTRWGEIVGLYDALARIRPTPVVALNRAMAVAQAGPQRGLAAVRAIARGDRLAAYPFYEAALGELELRCGRGEVAQQHFPAALALARNTAERGFLARRIADCEPA
jgi:predicted RNA polymerase sigma factor